MKVRRNTFYTALTLLLSLLLALLSAEGLVRILYPRLSNYNLEMWRYTKDLKEPLEDADLPFHHFPNREGEYYGVRIQTNRYGFRDGETATGKPDSIFRRILFLGDSFTMGWGVPEDSSFVSLVEDRLAPYRVETVNLGVGNYNTRMQVELFKRKGLHFEPDIVILMYFLNDVEMTPERTRLEYSIISKSYFLALLFDRMQRLRSLGDKDYNWRTYYGGLYQPGQPGLEINRHALAELAELCEEKGSELIVVSIPELHQLSPYPFWEATAYIEEIAIRQGVPFLDLLPSLSGRDPRSLWVSGEDTHANDLAHRLIANAVAEKLLDLGLLE